MDKEKMEKRVGICPQPTMSSNLFFFIHATSVMSSDLYLLSFSVTCLFKKSETEKIGKKCTYTVHWTVNRLPTPFDIPTRSTISHLHRFPSSNYGTRKDMVTFGEWKTVKAITFGAYLAKIECDTTSPSPGWKCFWSIPSTLHLLDFHVFLRYTSTNPGLLELKVEVEVSPSISVSESRFVSNATSLDYSVRNE